MEVEEKVDLTAVGTETWTDSPAETRENQTFAFDQSKDSASVPEAEPEDAVSVGDRSDWYGGEEGVESGSECPRLESSDCQRNNTTSVIVSVQGSSETAGDCSTTEVGKEEESGNNQSVTTTTPGRQSAPGKVISTDVTINSLTVTFKEATVAEGFFKGY